MAKPEDRQTAPQHGFPTPIDYSLPDTVIYQAFRTQPYPTTIRRSIIRSGIRGLEAAGHMVLRKLPDWKKDIETDPLKHTDLLKESVSEATVRALHSQEQRTQAMQHDLGGSPIATAFYMLVSPTRKVDATIDVISTLKSVTTSTSPNELKAKQAALNTLITLVDAAVHTPFFDVHFLQWIPKDHQISVMLNALTFLADKYLKQPDADLNVLQAVRDGFVINGQDTLPYLQATLPSGLSQLAEQIKAIAAQEAPVVKKITELQNQKITRRNEHTLQARRHVAQKEWELLKREYTYLMTYYGEGINLAEIIQSPIKDIPPSVK